MRLSSLVVSRGGSAQPRASGYEGCHLEKRSRTQIQAAASTPSLGVAWTLRRLACLRGVWVRPTSTSCRTPARGRDVRVWCMSCCWRSANRLRVSRDGVIDGTPQQSGVYSFQIRALKDGDVDFQTYTLTILAKLNQLRSSIVARLRQLLRNELSREYSDLRPRSLLQRANDGTRERPSSSSTAPRGGGGEGYPCVGTVACGPDVRAAERKAVVASSRTTGAPCS